MERLKLFYIRFEDSINYKFWRVDINRLAEIMVSQDTQYDFEYI